MLQKNFKSVIKFYFLNKMLVLFNILSSLYKFFYRRVTILISCGLLYSALWCSYFYFNATLQDAEGEDIPVHEAIHHFFRSPWWTDLKKSLSDTWTFLKTNGWLETWKLIIELSDPSGEQNAYKVLGLSHHANQTEINSSCRLLSVKWHPDKVKDPREKLTAQEKFYEVQEACEILSKNKARRSRRNKKSDS
uniref:J domain-containing protein n=1 Tax=Clastoptera arizonana TaxID=38151 RepID=A0A1B6CF93_9HEMI